MERTLQVIPHGRERWTVMLSVVDESVIFQLFGRDGRRLALAACMRLAPDVLHLNDLRVPEERQRRKGVGTALLSTLLEAAARSGRTATEIVKQRGDAYRAVACQLAQTLGHWRQHL